METLTVKRMALTLTAVIVGAFSMAVGCYGQGRTGSGYSQYGQSWTVPDGTVLSVKMDSTLNSRDSHAGDKFTATVTIPVYVNGRTVIPAGSVIEGRVTQVTPAKRMSKSGTIAVDFDDIVFPNGTRLPVSGSLTSADPADRATVDDEGQVSGGSTTKRSAVFIGGGGAVGAVLGGIAGGGSGAILGGIIGAGTGVAGVLLQKGEEAEVRAGTPFGVRLNQPLDVSQSNIGDSAQRQPDYDPNNDGSNPGGRPRYTRRGDRDADQPAPPASASSEPGSGAPDSQASESEGGGQPEPETQPGESRTQPGAARTEASGPPPQPDPPLSSPEMVKRAQQALQDQGYYEGNVDGVMNARTSNSLKAYQHDRHLSETGDLDPATAKSLGIVGRQAVSAVPSRSAGAGGYGGGNPQAGSSGDYSGGAGSGRPEAGGGDSSIAYPTRRGSRSSDASDSGAGGGYGEPGGYGRPRSRGSYGDQSRSGRPGVSYEGRSGDQGLGRTISQQADELLAQYEGMIGVNPNGRSVQVERASYGDPEMELLFAFSNFANAARLYSQLSASMDSGSRRSLVLALAREARRTDRVFTTSNSQSAQSLAARWDGIRQNVLRLMDSQNITAAEIEEK